MNFELILEKEHLLMQQSNIFNLQGKIKPLYNTYVDMYVQGVPRIVILRIDVKFEVISFNKSFNQIYFTLQSIPLQYDCHIIFFIILFGIKQLNKLCKETFWTINQQSCFFKTPYSSLRNNTTIFFQISLYATHLDAKWFKINNMKQKIVFDN